MSIKVRIPGFRLRLARLSCGHKDLSELSSACFCTLRRGVLSLVSVALNA